VNYQTVTAALPAVTVAFASLCALWPPARRMVWLALALALVNVLLTPFSSGEWFYQHAESTDYRGAIASGDFTGFREVMGRHDPHRLRRMVSLAICLLFAVSLLALVHARASRGRTSTVMSAIVVAIVLLVGAATIVQAYHRPA